MNGGYEMYKRKTTRQPHKKLNHINMYKTKQLQVMTCINVKLLDKHINKRVLQML